MYIFKNISYSTILQSQYNCQLLCGLFSGLEWAVRRHEGVPQGVGRGEQCVGGPQEERLRGRIHLDVSVNE